MNSLTSDKQDLFDSMTMADKVAVLLIQMGDEVALSVFKSLSLDILTIISESIAKYKNIDKAIAMTVVDEFYTLFESHNIVGGGGMDYARDLISKTLSPEEAKKLFDKLNQTAAQNLTFGFLSKVKPQQLSEFIENEHPQTIALIIAHLNPTNAAEVLSHFSDEMKAEISIRIANLGELSPQIVKKVSSLLEARLEAFIGSKVEIGGDKSVAEILNRSGQKVAKDTLVFIEQKDINLANTIKEMMFVFDDIITFDDTAIKEILKAIDQNIIMLALKGSNDGMRQKFTSNMSTRAAEAFEEELSFLGAVKVREVEGAQRKIIDTVKQLGESGIIDINHDEEVIE
jgi:flagellar motor switch protein FliG